MFIYISYFFGRKKKYLFLSVVKIPYLTQPLSLKQLVQVILLTICNTKGLKQTKVYLYKTMWKALCQVNFHWVFLEGIREPLRKYKLEEEMALKTQGQLVNVKRDFRDMERSVTCKVALVFRKHHTSSLKY